MSPSRSLALVRRQPSSNGSSLPGASSPPARRPAATTGSCTATRAFRPKLRRGKRSPPRSRAPRRPSASTRWWPGVTRSRIWWASISGMRLRAWAPTWQRTTTSCSTTTPSRTASSLNGRSSRRPIGSRWCEAWLKAGGKGSWSISSLRWPTGTSAPYSSLSVDVFADWNSLVRGVPLDTLWPKVHPNITSAEVFERLAKTRSVYDQEVYKVVDVVEVKKSTSLISSPARMTPSTTTAQ